MRYFTPFFFLSDCFVCCFLFINTLYSITEELKKEQRWSDRDLQDSILRFTRHRTLPHADFGESNIVDGKVVMTGVKKSGNGGHQKRYSGQLVYNPIHDRFGISFEEKTTKLF
ncbi:MAG: hypothetical protein IPL23_10910 [Saprospiraceae bacterium]|nr:hypothetical protein [Saprospiraceae bacterium]